MLLLLLLFHDAAIIEALPLPMKKGKQALVSTDERSFYALVKARNDESIVHAPALYYTHRKMLN